MALGMALNSPKRILPVPKEYKIRPQCVEAIGRAESGKLESGRFHHRILRAVNLMDFSISQPAADCEPGRIARASQNWGISGGFALEHMVHIL
jgi:hypothetical protein